jgi:hypothetical protein
MLNLRGLSGRYRGSFPGGQLELRVDVDGVRPAQCVSGDLYSGPESSYESSFIVDSLTKSETPDQVIVEGIGRFSDGSLKRKVRTILHKIAAIPQATSATLQILKENGALEREVQCMFESGFFRTIMLKEDIEKNVTRFDKLDLEPGASPSSVTIATSLQDAGIDVIPIEPSEKVQAPPGKTWSNAELHAAMERNFKELEQHPQWKAWLFHARRSETNGTLGIMFDEQGSERHGCAVFYNALATHQGFERKRDQAHTCLHELGHCFNLHHPFPLRADALTWMNYPAEFPGGEDDFWKAFQFQFENDELVHLRHGFRDDVIMGGRPFEGSASLRFPGTALQARRVPGLQLRLEAPNSLDFGEPVRVEIRLSCEGRVPMQAHPFLHPRDGLVQFWIGKPGGQTVAFEPFFRRCRKPESVTLNESRPSIYESAYLGFGKRGLYFRQPGLYQIRAAYRTAEGMSLFSNSLDLRLRSPFSREDDEIADRYLGDQQGRLFALRGSDATSLTEGNRKLEEVVEDYGSNPLAGHARMIKGYNWAREFRAMSPEGETLARPPKPKKALQYIRPMAEDFVSGRSRIDNITFSRTIRRLAEGQLEVGDKRGAKTTLGELEGQLNQKRRACNEGPFKPYVLRRIQMQIKDGLDRASRG